MFFSLHDIRRHMSLVGPTIVYPSSNHIFINVSSPYFSICKWFLPSNYHCDVCEVLIFLIPESLPHLAVSVTLSKNTFLQHFIIIDLFILIYSYGFLFYVLLTVKFHYFSNAKHVQYLANGWLFNLALFILMCPIILQAVPLWPTPHDFPVLSFLFFSQS